MLIITPPTMLSWIQTRDKSIKVTFLLRPLTSDSIRFLKTGTRQIKPRLFSHNYLDSKELPFFKVLFLVCNHSVSYSGLTAHIQTAVHSREFIIRSPAIPDFYCYHDNHGVYTIVSNFLLATSHEMQVTDLSLGRQAEDRYKVCEKILFLHVRCVCTLLKSLIFEFAFAILIFTISHTKALNSHQTYFYFTTH